MSAAGLIRFAICVAFAAVWWVFLTPMIDSVNFLDPVGEVVSQQRLDCLDALILGFKISPCLLLIAIGIQFWATSLRRDSGTAGGIRLKTILSVYTTQVILIVICIAAGAVVDEFTLRFMELPAFNSSVPIDMMYMGLSWIYPLLTISMIALYVGLFIAIGRDVIYTTRSEGNKPKSDYW